METKLQIVLVVCMLLVSCNFSKDEINKELNSNIEEAFACRYSDIAKAELLLKEQLEKSIDLSYANGIIKCNNHLGNIKFLKCEYDPALQYYNKIKLIVSDSFYNCKNEEIQLKISDELKYCALAEANAGKAWVFERKGMFERAIKHLDSAENQLEKCRSKNSADYIYAETRICISQLNLKYYYKEEYEESVNEFKKAIETFNKLDDSLELAFIYYAQGENFSKIAHEKSKEGDSARLTYSIANAMDSYLKGLSLIKTNDIYMAANFIEGFALLLDNFDIKFFQAEQIETFEKWLNKSGVIYSENYEPIQLLKLSNSLFKSYGSPYQILANSFLIGECHLRKKEIDSASKYFDISRTLNDTNNVITNLSSEEIQHKNQQDSIWISKGLVSINWFIKLLDKEAVLLNHQGLSVYETLQKRIVLSEIINYNRKQEIIAQEKILKVEEESKYKRRQLLLIAITLIVLLASFLIYRYMASRVKNKKLREINNLIDKQLLPAISKEHTDYEEKVIEITRLLYNKLNTIIPKFKTFGIGIYNKQEDTFFYPVLKENGIGDNNEELELTYDFNEQKYKETIEYVMLSNPNFKVEEIHIRNFTRDYPKFGFTKLPEPIVGENTDSKIYISIEYKNNKTGLITIQSGRNKLSTQDFEIMKIISRSIGNALSLSKIYKELRTAYESLKKDNTLLNSKFMGALMDTHFLCNAIQPLKTHYFNLLNKVKEKGEKLSTLHIENACKLGIDDIDLFTKLLEYQLRNYNTNINSFVPLKNEIEFNTMFVEYYKKIYNVECSFKIDTTQLDAGLVENIEIPPLTIQPFIENAIYWGFKPIKNLNGHQNILEVKIENYEEETIKCIISDNGIGREESNKLKQNNNGIRSNGLATQKTKDRLILLNQKIKSPIEYTDHANDKGRGTTVSILIPIK